MFDITFILTDMHKMRRNKYGGDNTCGSHAFFVYIDDNESECMVQIIRFKVFHTTFSFNMLVLHLQFSVIKIYNILLAFQVMQTIYH